MADPARSWRRRRRHAWRPAAILCAGVVLVGCSGPASRRSAVPVVDQTASLRAEAERVIAAHNERVARLERLWARVTLVVEGGAEDDGSRFREQAEGHLQIERPGRVSLSLGKLGDERLYLGSNDERYWWIDRVDPDARVAYVGRHDAISPAKLRSFGFPLHPLDLVELLAVRPIEPSTVGEAYRGGEGTVVVPERRSEGVTVLYAFDPETTDLREVGVRRPGFARAQATHSRTETVPVEGDARERGRMATRFDIFSTDLGGTAVLRLYEPTNRAIKPIAFDPDRLIRGYRIREVIDLDAEAAR